MDNSICERNSISSALQAKKSAILSFLQRLFLSIKFDISKATPLPVFATGRGVLSELTEEITSRDRR